MLDSSFEQRFQELQAAGRIEECASLVLNHASENTLSDADLRGTFMCVASNSVFSHFGKALEVISPRLEAFSQDHELLFAFGWMCWVEREYDAAESVLKSVIALARAYVPGYRQLAMVYLTTQRWSEAFFVISAARLHCNDLQLFGDLFALAEMRMRGVSQVSFELDDETYTFGLSCFNGQAMEADVHHVTGTLVEVAELRFLKQWVGEAKRIVECGCLVGNHTVYFLRNLNPARIDIFDASQRSLDETIANIGLNARDSDGTVFNFNHKAIAAESGHTIPLLGAEVETISLPDAIPSDADFVKIDIDGAEVEALEGLLTALQNSRAKLMIEVRENDVNEFTNRLEDIGYKPVNTEARSITHNLFFEPKVFGALESAS